MTAGWPGRAAPAGVGGPVAGKAAPAARLRPMGAADLPGVIALEHELFPEDPWSAEMFADEVAQSAESRLYLVAETGLPDTGLAETGPPDTGPADTGPAGTGQPDTGLAETGLPGTGLPGTGLAETGLPGTWLPDSGRAGPGAGQPVLSGYAGLLFVPGGLAADVLTIAVRPGYWGRGIGSALLGALLAAATARGCAEVMLEVRADNPRAQGLYARRGFAAIGVRRGYYQPSGTDAIVMRKDLR